MRPALLALLLLLTGLLDRPALAVELAEAERRLARGDVGGALDIARQRANEAPADLAAQELLIDLMLATSQARDAVARYQAFLEQAPQDADRHYLLGRAQGDPNASQQSFARALQLRPGHPQALTGLAAVLRSRGDLDGAVAAYEAALAQKPDLSEAWAGLRAVAMIRRDGSALSAFAQRAVQADPGDPQHWLAAAASTPGQAPALLEQALKLHPGSPDLQVARARAAFETGDLPRAAKSYQKALEIGTGDAVAVHVEAALVDEIRAGAITAEGARDLLQVRGLDDPGLALDRLDALVLAHPHSGWARLVRGNMRAARRSTVLAEEDLRAALDRMPATPEAWGALGSFLLGQHRAKEARPLLAKAAKVRPADISLVVAAAIAAAEAGDVPVAEKELRAAMARFPSSTGPPLGLARLLLSTGRPEQALTVLEEALSTHPDLTLAGALVSAAKEAGKPEAAIEILDRVAQRTGDSRLQRAADGLRAQAPK